MTSGIQFWLVPDSEVVRKTWFQLALSTNRAVPIPAKGDLGRCPSLVWVGPLALIPDLVKCHHPGIRQEPTTL